MFLNFLRFLRNSSQKTYFDSMLAQQFLFFNQYESTNKFANKKKCQKNIFLVSWS
jgi:hypothetical protein